MRRLLIVILLLMLGLSACSRNKTQLSTEARLKAADELFAKGKYAHAALIYDEISFERKSESTAYATLKQVDCYFEINKFADAQAKYEQFIESFPDHADTGTAYYKVGVCLFEQSLSPHYDQTETISSIEAFRVFIDKYPADSRYEDALGYIRKAQYKLLEKSYLNGYISYKMKDYSAALMYFDEITGLSNTDELDRKSLYYSAKLHLHQKNNELAKLSYDNLLAKYPDSKEAKRLSRRFK